MTGKRQKASNHMKKWQCLVCDLIYDEAEGWPDDGITPGTRWEDVPQDWKCPYCGVGKEDFEMIEIKEPAASSGSPSITENTDIAIDESLEPIVIIGAGMAAYNLVKEVRKLDKNTPIKIISSDDGNLYYKPNLSCMLTRGKFPDELVMTHDLVVDVMPFTQITALDPENKQITAGHETIKYAKLILATGAEIIRLPIKGDGASSINSINNLLDYRKFRSDLVGKSHVTIIGAGLIGCEFANDLLNAGIKVEIIDMFDHCMPNLLPQAVGKVVQNALTDLGAKFHFKTKAENVNKDDGKFRIVLSNGMKINTDLVISAVGLKPRIELAQAAGLAVNRGIMVNRYLTTSEPDIYAIGDCAEVEGHNLMYVEPLLICARALAASLTGTPTMVHYNAMPIIIKTPACPVSLCPAPENALGEWHIDAEGNDIRAIFTSPEGEILAFALTGKYAPHHQTLKEQLPKILNDDSEI